MQAVGVATGEADHQMINQFNVNQRQGCKKLAGKAVICAAGRAAIAGVIVRHHDAGRIGLYGKFKHFTRKNRGFVHSATGQDFVFQYF